MKKDTNITPNLTEGPSVFISGISVPVYCSKTIKFYTFFTLDQTLIRAKCFRGMIKISNSNGLRILFQK